VYDENWAMDESFKNKRLWVHIRNTKPNEVRYVSAGSHPVQDKKAMVTDDWLSSALGLDVAGVSERVYLPPHFLIPAHPTKDNQTVIVLEGEKKGEVFKTVRVQESPARFKLSPFMLTKRKGGLEMEACKLALSDYKKPPPSRLM
jgi:hypothetical protein